MLTMARTMGLLSTLLLITATTAAPTPVDQTVLSPNDMETFDSEEHILRVNTTFDAVNLSHKNPMEPLEGYGYLQFDNYKIFDPKSAAEKDLLNASDINCAASSPNALLISPNEYNAPAIFQSNATALAAANVSHYFDFVSFVIKPLVLNSTFVLAEMNAWTINDGNAENVQSLEMGFGSQTGVFSPWLFTPALYFPGWGEKANFIEFKGEDEEGNPVAFCLDDIVLEFHRPYDDEKRASRYAKAGAFAVDDGVSMWVK